MPKAKVTAAAYLLLVFGSGVLVGAVAHRLYMVKTVLSNEGNPQPPRREGPAEWRKHFMSDLQTKVKLDDDQVTKVHQILDDTDQDLRQVHAKRHAEDQAAQAELTNKINALLREDQKPLYQQFRAEREAERKRQRGPQGQPPPKK